MPRRLAHSPTSTEVKFTEALSGGHALTAQLGGGYDGIALSATFSSAEASPLPMVLVGLIVTVFLLFEARRYRYFNVWRAKKKKKKSRTYAWIFVIQAVAYYGKLAIHPTPLGSLADFWERAAIGPIPGELVVVAGVLFHGGWALFALVTYRIEIASRRERQSLIAMG